MISDDDPTPVEPPSAVHCRCVVIPISRWRWPLLRALGIGLAVLIVFVLFLAVIYDLSHSAALWGYFARRHHCQIIERRGEWATYFCDDGLEYSRRAE